MHNINKTILIVGASGLLGRNFVLLYLEKKYKVIACYQEHIFDCNADLCVPVKLNILNDEHIKIILELYKPTIIIHCAGLTNVDICEKNIKLAYQLNAQSVKKFAVYAKIYNIQFIYISTDHLFEGDQSFYKEDDIASPINIYGKSKLEGENIALYENDNSLIIRTNFFGKGTYWRRSFTDWLWLNVNQNKLLRVFEDSFFSPIAMSTLVQIVDKLIYKNARGIFNVCGAECVSKFEFAIRFTKYFQLNKNLIVASLMESANLIARRPKSMSLNTEKVCNFLSVTTPNIQQSFEVVAVDYKVGLND